jgi:hypothetical protein
MNTVLTIYITGGFAGLFLFAFLVREGRTNDDPLARMEMQRLEQRHRRIKYVVMGASFLLWWIWIPWVLVGVWKVKRHGMPGERAKRETRG